MASARFLARVVLAPLGLAVALALLLRLFVNIYSVPSVSMWPTLRVGDLIVATPYRGQTPERGDVVVFRSPRADEILVKRVIAVPGDLIESHLGRVAISGHTLPERYLAEPAASGAMEPQIIPDGCLYVMGDNRVRSVDSRSWGVIARGEVLGRARLVLWSSRIQPLPLEGRGTPTRVPDGLRLFHIIE